MHTMTVDSDFTGLWSHKNSHLCESAMSRAGYIIMYCGCPIHCWVSKLQSKIALSTTEAEYIALSMYLHDLLPIKTILAELCNGFDLGYQLQLFLVRHLVLILECTNQELFMKTTQVALNLSTDPTNSILAPNILA
jgi:hypothetical protein